jgi:hypothetical protein
MATSGRGTGIVGYNVQTAVDTENHLIVAHEVTNVGNDRGQLAMMAEPILPGLGYDVRARIDRPDQWHHGVRAVRQTLGSRSGGEVLRCRDTSRAERGGRS